MSRTSWNSGNFLQTWNCPASMISDFSTFHPSANSSFCKIYVKSQQTIISSDESSSGFSKIFDDSIFSHDISSEISQKSDFFWNPVPHMQIHVGRRKSTKKRQKKLVNIHIWFFVVATVVYSWWNIYLRNTSFTFRG